jgi:DNA ligase-1
MRAFASLIQKIDSTNKTNEKVAALAAYFEQAPDQDKLWTIALLSHRRPKRPVNTTLLREWATELSGIPLWLFEESYHIVGDLAETIALILPSKAVDSNKSLSRYIQEIIALREKEEAEKKAYLHQNWQVMSYYERFVFNKIITGGFRIGISQKLMTRALSRATGLDEDILAYKLMGDWKPESTSFNQLILQQNEQDLLSKPYPFYLAYAVEEGFEDQLGAIEKWCFEHKWDGIRAQVIVRDGQVFTWSRGEELVSDKFPEFDSFTSVVPDGTVLDGEIVPFPNGRIGNFKELQTRLGRKNVGKRLLAQTPVILIAYDLLEWDGKDIRKEPFETRRKLLDNLVQQQDCETTGLYLSQTMTFDHWDEAAAERERSREKYSEGLMIKRKASPYLVGRKKGDWWKWKVDPFSIDAVLTYAMRGHGRRANLYTDYTFGLWHEGELVTFAKAYSGLTDKEFREIDAWIKKNTLERFGPVRSVVPRQVFEIAFEGIAISKRHKSGVATRFPRILRWRKDKTIEQANTLDDLKAMIPR